MLKPWDRATKVDAVPPHPGQAAFERWKGDKGFIEDADGYLVSRELVRSKLEAAGLSLGVTLVASIFLIAMVRDHVLDNPGFAKVLTFASLILAASAAYFVWAFRHDIRSIAANRHTGFAASFRAVVAMNVLALLIPLAAAFYLVRFVG